MSLAAHVANGVLDRAIHGGRPKKSYEEMSVEELEGAFRAAQERRRLARWTGRVAGAMGAVVGGPHVMALLS